MGVPAKIVRPITEEEKNMIIKTQENYYRLAQEYRNALK
jgi:carbonic anhydrase/acetyltransferase-like protein (isoleucine patch superfamily)